MISRILLPTGSSETAGKALHFILGMKPCGAGKVARKCKRPVLLVR